MSGLLRALKSVKTGAKFDDTIIFDPGYKLCLRAGTRRIGKRVNNIISE